MTHAPDDVKKIRMSRMNMFWVVAVFAVPMLAAGYMFKAVPQGGLWGTTNKGHLIAPAIPLQAFAMPASDGSTYSLQDMQGGWVLVYFAAQPCNEACKKDIYHLRQLNAALGKDMNRVERLLVLADQQQYAELAAFLQAYSLQRVVTDDSVAVQRFSKQFAVYLAEDGNRIFLVDPLGNLMMAYPEGVEPKAILQDLQRLLKISQIG